MGREQDIQMGGRYPSFSNKPRITAITKVETETPTIKTLTFSDDACSTARPGQFIMVWIPGVDEIPISLSRIGTKNLSSITVKSVGEATVALHSLKRGDSIGVRGPYGHGFDAITGNILVVGGGIGFAPLAPLVDNLTSSSSKISLIVGAKTRDELLFLDRIKLSLSKTDTRIVFTTEDGSFGFKGLATVPVETMLARQRFDMIYACGPERMMHKTFQLAEQYTIPFQASLERLMRCSIGLCGSCVIGRFRVCTDGPVFTSKQLREIATEFGKFKRDSYSRRVGV